MTGRASTLGLCLVAMTLLPGCAVSLFSEAKHNPESAAKIKQLEQRMDVVDAALKARSAN